MSRSAQSNSHQTPGSHLRGASRRTTRALPILLALTLLCAGPWAPVADAETGDGNAVAQKGGKKHRKRAKRPITMGRSGGNVNDFEIDGGFILCGTGTLGALLEKNEELYILSNNHVLAMTNQGKRGDEIVQPGLADNRCDPGEDNGVADLAGYKKIRLKKTNKVDVALARIREGAVNETGKVMRIGIPGNETAPAELGMRVQKSGRTTGITKGFVVATNVTLQVEFAPAADGEDGPVVRFKEQIIVEGDGQDFSLGGDSGSVIYEDVDDCPRAVGLLFAGGEGFTAAGRMDTVLKVAGKLKPKGTATLVGCTPAQTASAVTQGAETQGSTAQGAVATRPIQSPDRDQLILARRARRINENALLSQRGVVGIGVGVGRFEPGRAVLKVFVSEASEEILERIPAELGGVPTEVVVTGRFRAF